MPERPDQSLSYWQIVLYGHSIAVRCRCSIRVLYLILSVFMVNYAEVNARWTGYTILPVQSACSPDACKVRKANIHLSYTCTPRSRGDNPTNPRLSFAS